MQTILSLKFQNSKLGKPLVIVTTPDRPHFLSVGQWVNKGYSMNLEAYVGGQIEVDYFQKGEELLNGDVAQDSDVITRDFIVKMDAEVLGKAIAAESATKAQGFADAARLFARNAAEARKKKAEAEAKGQPVGAAEGTN